MTNLAAHAWLPMGAASRPQIRAIVEEAVAAWSGAWFSTQPLGVTGAKALVELKPRADRPVFGTVTSIGYSARAIARLLDWALDATLDQVTLTPADQQVLDTFERQMIEDLAARIESALGLNSHSRSAPQGLQGGLEVLVGDVHAGDLLTVTLPLQALLGAVRASLPAPRATNAITSLGAAIAPSALTVEVVLGTAGISLGDLRGLAVGDVLVLDTKLAGAAQLSLSGADDVFARGVLTDMDGHMAVALQA